MQPEPPSDARVIRNTVVFQENPQDQKLQDFVKKFPLQKRQWFLSLL